MIGPMNGMLPTSAPIATTMPTTTTISSGMMGANRKLRNLLTENLRAERMLIFSSRATCTAAMRLMAPPKIAHSTRK